MKTRIPLMLFAILLLSSACKKLTPDPEKQVTFRDQQVASISLEIERFINEMEFIARAIKLNYPNQPGILNGTTITKGQTEEGKEKYDILFTSLTGADSKVRNGKLTVVLEDAVENGSLVTGKHLHVRSDDEANLFSVNGLKFKGSLVFSNIQAARNSTDSIAHLNAQSFLILPDNAGQIRFSSTRKSRWTAGNNTAEINDDVFEISRQNYSLALVTNSGTSFVEVENKTPLVLNNSCSALFSPKKGILEIKDIAGNTRWLNFGNGNCSDLPMVVLPNP